MDTMVAWNKIQPRTSMPIVSPIFHARVVLNFFRAEGVFFHCVTLCFGLMFRLI